MRSHGDPGGLIGTQVSPPISYSGMMYMNQYDGTQNRRSEDGRECDERKGKPDVDWTSLSGFQRDLLLSIKWIEEEEGAPSGSKVKSDVSDRYGSSINHGRLYQNLDDLVETGLVEKSFHDGRTNAYRLTSDGHRLLHDAAHTLANTCNIESTG